MNTQTKWGVYLHIPFCLQKCHYCDFISYTSSAEMWDQYTEMIRKEIKIRGSLLSYKNVDSIFFGGGTPSLLGPERLGSILEEIRREFTLDAVTEVSFEVNPETVSKEDWGIFKEKGFTRASIGIQSLQDQELINCGRVHNGLQGRNAVNHALAAGFEHVNVDLMYGLPGQTYSSLRETLHEVCKWEIDHLSIYGLQIEEETLFGSLAAEGKLSLPVTEEEEAMYDWIQNYLPQQGFQRYEISNFARSNGECKQNLKYWNYEPYLGFGAAACGFDGKGRLNHSGDLKEYFEWVSHLEVSQKLPENSEALSLKELQGEYCFMNFRKKTGLSLRAFSKRFGVDFESLYPEAIVEGTTKGWIRKEGDCYVVTEEGFRFNNLLGQLFL